MNSNQNEKCAILLALFKPLNNDFKQSCPFGTHILSRRQNYPVVANFVSAIQF